MQLEDIILSEVSQDEKHKSHMLFLILEHRFKDKHIHKNKPRHNTNSDVEHVCSSGTTLWNSGKEGK
jgi:hypothetical protein